jgi:hypothetical protein
MQIRIFSIHNTQNPPNLIRLSGVKPRGAVESERNARLAIGESRKFGFMDYKSSAQCAYILWALRNPTWKAGSESRKDTKSALKKKKKEKNLVLQFAELDILSRELVASHTPIVSHTWSYET